MLLVREITYCKPGKVKNLIEIQVAMAKLLEEAGQGKMRIMTDFCAERYWTIVTEYEVPSMQAFEEMMQGKGMTPELGEKMEKISAGYHEFVDHGRREIFKIEH